jgi:hypothetical protein
VANLRRFSWKIFAVGFLIFARHLNLLIETVGKHGERSEEESRDFVGSSQQSLDLLLGEGEPGAFTREWEAKFTR